MGSKHVVRVPVMPPFPPCGGGVDCGPADLDWIRRGVAASVQTESELLCEILVKAIWSSLGTTWYFPNIARSRCCVPATLGLCFTEWVEFGPGTVDTRSSHCQQTTVHTWEAWMAQMEPPEYQDCRWVLLICFLAVNASFAFSRVYV